MNMFKTSTVKVFATACIAAGVVFTSCSKDDDPPVPAPVVSSLEVGTDDSHTAIAGSDIHLEAEIEAPGKISTITVEIHSESGPGWEFTQVWDEFSGQLNATFHEHIDIPEDAAPGEYHLHFTVMDMAGNATEIEEELEIQAAANIDIALEELGHGTIGSSHAHAGEEMHVEGMITSVYPIATVHIEIHSETDPNAPEIEAEYTNYAGQTSAEFHEHIDIPATQPAGDYHFHMTVTDDQGHSNSVEYELEIE